jgi:hypothetical protein
VFGPEFVPSVTNFEAVLVCAAFAGPEIADAANKAALDVNASSAAFSIDALLMTMLL